MQYSLRFNNDNIFVLFILSFYFVHLLSLSQFHSVFLLGLLSLAIVDTSGNWTCIHLNWVTSADNIVEYKSYLLSILPFAWFQNIYEVVNVSSIFLNSPHPPSTPLSPTQQFKYLFYYNFQNLYILFFLLFFSFAILCVKTGL